MRGRVEDLMMHSVPPTGRQRRKHIPKQGSIMDGDNVSDVFQHKYHRKLRPDVVNGNPDELSSALDVPDALPQTSS